jgi:hypothetical protein
MNDPTPYYLVSGIRPSGLVWRFDTEAEALAYAGVTANNRRLRLLVTRIDPAEPEVLCTIVAEFSEELPF